MEALAAKRGLLRFILNITHELMRTVSILVSTISVTIACLLVVIALFLSPLQDWTGNEDQMDTDRVLVISTGLVLAIVLGIVGAYAGGNDRGSPAVVLRVLNMMIALIALLIGIVKWFPHFEG